MMNPWDRENTWREPPGGNEAPAAGNGWAWLIAVIVAVVALVVFSRSNGNHLVLVPIGISVFFMFMFLLNHRREARRLEASRRVQRLADAARRAQDGPEAMGFEPPQPARDDASLRRVFDRFDMKVIEHGRNNKWEPKQISSLLEMARDYVDTPHASLLLKRSEETELERHLDAALERALLQYDIANNRKGDDRRESHYYDDAPPF